MSRYADWRKSLASYDPRMRKDLELVYFQARYSDLVRTLGAHESAIEVLSRPLGLIQRHTGRAFDPAAWLDYLDGVEDKDHPGLAEDDASQLDRMNLVEWYLVYRWLLDRAVAFLGDKRSEEDREAALELFNETVTRLRPYLSPSLVGEVLEYYQPQISDPSLAADVYFLLFGIAFADGNQVVESYLYAVQGLEKARASGDEDRISWAWYNWTQYHLHYGDGDGTEVMEKALEYLAEDRYFELLGYWALKDLEAGNSPRALRSLERLYVYFRERAGAGAWDELEPILLNLVYFTQNLAALYHDQNRVEESQEVLDYLIELLRTQRDLFLGMEESFMDETVDWQYQYYTFHLETLLWSFLNLTVLGKNVQSRLQEIRQFLKRCPYNLEAVMEKFFQDHGLDYPL